MQVVRGAAWAEMRQVGAWRTMLSWAWRKARARNKRRVGEARQGFAAEALADGVDRELRRDLAMQVAAHAVGNHHQHGVVGRQPATRSWLMSRPPMRLSWMMLYFITSP
jgi:hypothetical protein